MTMNGLIIKYPLDLTGLSADNLVTNESHTAPRDRARGFAPNYGAFYTKSVHLVHVTSGRPLVAGTDYQCLHLYEKATKASGQEVCAAIQILNDELDGEFLLTYQVVGGEFSANVSVIEELLKQLALDNRSVKWGDILGLPNAFPPSEHLHDVDDLYGFEYLVEAMERIRSALLLGDYYDHEEIRQRIETLRKYVDELNASQGDALELHTQDHANPHQTTKAQVQLGSVENYPPATQAEILAGTKNRYVTADQLYTRLQSFRTDVVIRDEVNFGNSTVYANVVNKIAYVGSNGWTSIGSRLVFTNSGEYIQASTGLMTFSNVIDVYDLTSRSDPRDKYDIEELEAGELYRIIRESGVTYSYKLKKGDVPSIGLMADTVRTTRLELSGTTTNEAGEERLTLRPTALIAVHHGVLARLLERVEALESETDALRSRVQYLENYTGHSAK